MDPDDSSERARRAADMLARHVRLQALSPQARDEVVAMLGEAILQGWLHDASMETLVDSALEVVESEGPEHIPIRIVDPDTGSAGG